MTTAAPTRASPRPAYEELIGDLKAGRIDAVVAWHPDRLHRSPRELEDFIDLVAASTPRWRLSRPASTTWGSASGRMTARVVGAVARAESEHKSERTSRASTGSRSKNFVISRFGTSAR